MFETIFKKLTPDCEPWVLEQTIQLAVELAREGREGCKIGTMFVVGDEEAALKQSMPLESKIAGLRTFTCEIAEYAKESDQNTSETTG